MTDVVRRFAKMPKRNWVMDGMPHSRAQLHNMIKGHMIMQGISVVSRLKIPDLLEHAAMSVDEIAQQVGINADNLFRLMRALSSVGIFSRPQQQHFALAPMGRWLLSSQADSLRALAVMNSDVYFWNQWGRAFETITGRGVPSKAMEEGSGWRNYEMDETEFDYFNQAMKATIQPLSRAITKAFDFSPFNSLADVGGGTGMLLEAILQTQPTLAGQLIDLPYVVEASRRALAGSSAVDRIDFMGIDIVNEPLPHAACLLLKDVMHNWDDKTCVQLLRKCRTTLSLAGRLLIVENLMLSDNEEQFAWLDVHLMVAFNGKVRSFEQFKSLSKQAGFNVAPPISLPGEYHLIVGVPD
jgi:hypothetical protein